MNFKPTNMNPLQQKLRASWKTPALAALCVANAALGLSLLADVLPAGFAAPAKAQQQQQQIGRPSEYLLVPAQLTSANQEIIYIIDTQNGDLTAAAFNRQNGISFIPPLRLSQNFDNAAR